MKEYSKPVISITELSNESVITLSGTGAQAFSSSSEKLNRVSQLGLNS